MEGLGHGYDAFVERIQADFTSTNAHNASNASAQNLDAYALYPPQFAFGVRRQPSPSATEHTSIVGGSSAGGDVAMQESALSVRQVHDLRKDVNLMLPNMPPRHHGHRRAHSEMKTKDLGMFETPLGSNEAVDDLFSMYIDVERLNSNQEISSSGGHSSRSPSDISSEVPCQPHHIRSLSVDGAFTVSLKPAHQQSHYCTDDKLPSKQNHLPASELNEVKKAMPAEELAELALMDPKRAKRILANRQSAARSKERKVRYISELERKVQTLQTEATTLSAQLTMLQRDTEGLMSENNELRCRLHSVEQQAQLREALNAALRDEVERLKVATGQMNGMDGNMMSPQLGLPQYQ